MILINSQQNEILESIEEISKCTSLVEWYTADLLPRIFLTSLVVGLLYLLLYLIYRWLTSFDSAEREERVYQRKMTWLFFLIIFISGYILYFIGFYEAGTSKSLAIIVRPIMASLSMFFLDNNFQELNSQCLDSPVYMSFFAAINLSAIIFSIAFIIYSFWKRVWSWCISTWWILKAKFLNIRNKDIFIFFGFSNQNIHLANSLGKDERIVFVALPRDHNINKSLTSFTSFLSSFYIDYDSDKLNSISDLNYVLKYASIHPADDKGSDNSANNKRSGESLSLRKWNLHKLVSLIKYHRKASFFFMSDCEEDNVLSTMNFIKTGIFNSDPDKEINIYCHARRNRKNLILQSLLPHNSKIKINIIDSSYLAVSSLKNLKKDHVINGIQKEQISSPPVYISHPINFVEVEQGYVTSAFNAMIIGFGETGLEVLKFLYEFGSFIGKDNKKTPFKCYCIDEDMETKKNDFFLDIPFAQTLETNKEIDFLNYSYNDDNFHTLLKDKINELNYVVITIGDNEKSFQMAFDIIDYARRFREREFKHFHVFIHEKNTANALSLKAMEVYNQMSNFNRFGELSKINSDFTDVISRFGSPEAIFNKAIVIGEERIEIEKGKFRKDYNEKSITKEIKTEKTKTDPYLTFISYQKADRGEKQQESNSLHIYTKQVVAQIKTLNDVDKVVANKDLIEKLSRLEHLRWTSHMYMRGFLLMDIKMETEMALKNPEAHSSEFVKVHSCLIDYDSLIEKYKENDRNVVIRSLTELKKYYQGPLDTIVLDKKKDTKIFIPQPIDTSDIELPKELMPLIEQISKNVHDVWAESRLKQGWKYGEHRDEKLKTHSCLIPYEDLPEEEKNYDRSTSIGTLKLILKLGFNITKK